MANKSVWIEKLPGGYQVRHRDSSGKKVSHWLANYDDAIRMKAELTLSLTAKAQGQIDPTLKTYDTFFSYLDWCEREGRRAATLQIKRGALQGFIKTKTFLIEAATEVNVRNYKLAMFEQGLNRSTVKIRLSELRAFLNWCKTEKLLLDIPKIEVTDPEVSRRKMSEQELQILENYLAPQFRPFYFLMKEHGTRNNETRLAEGHHFDLVNKTWTIPAENSKGKKERVIPLADKAIEELTPLFVNGKLPPGPLFMASKGKLWKKTASNDYLRRARINANKELQAQNKPLLDRIFPHLFRHTRASNWKGSPYAMMSYMGWSSWAMGKRYSHHNVEDLRKEAQK